MKRLTIFLTTVLASISLSAYAGSDKSFDDVDKDGDKNISQYELREAGKDVDVSEIDQDNDGVVSEEEFNAWKESKKQEKHNKEGNQ